MAQRLSAKGMNPYMPLVLHGMLMGLQGRSTNFAAVTIGPCLVGYNTHTPWWSAHKILVEEFIFRYKPGPFSDTLSGMEELATSLGCGSVCIGTLAMIREETYAALLSRKGYRRVAQQLIKEL
jgi:hypothetical protein